MIVEPSPPNLSLRCVNDPSTHAIDFFNGLVTELEIGVPSTPRRSGRRWPDGVSGTLIGESFLSFLGMGVKPPTATWGNMINQAIDLFSIAHDWRTPWVPA